MRTYLTLIAAAVALAAGAPRADAKPPAPQGNGQPKGPGIPGQMRSVSNAERNAAATRNADRRAADLRKHHGKHGKGH